MPELLARYIEWGDALWEFGSLQPWKDKTAFAKIEITREEYALAQQALYDECMAHQDHQLRRLVERLKAEGEWKNTLLIVASDSGYPAGGYRLMEPMEVDAPYFHPFATRIPLMFIWPERIQAGVRFSDSVSMIDVLPTVLELAGLPMPEIMQGQSLVPLLLDEGDWKARPVIIDMIAVEYTTGHLIGSIEVIDGRWGASLCINPVSPGKAPPARGYVADGLTGHYERKEELALYDLWNDPFCTKLMNEEQSIPI
jgi:arylsulfatase A-like enzyme